MTGEALADAVTREAQKPQGAPLTAATSPATDTYHVHYQLRYAIIPS